LTVSNLDKVLWPAAGYTKGAMLDYYVRVGPTLLPHLSGRPVTLRRFPDGIERAGWYQNDCPAGAPEWIRKQHVVWPSGRTWEFCALSDLPTLVWVANMATVELHPFFLRADRTREPTAVVFDLDPGPPADLVDCCRIALAIRDLLSELRLAAVAKVSGSVGLHVVVPLNSPHSWNTVKGFARALAGLLTAERPQEVVDRQRLTLRRGKVLVDWLQNDPTRSTVAPYSLRAAGWPTVSAPLSWEEIQRAATLNRPDLLIFEPPAVFERLDSQGDLFHDVLTLRQRLPAPVELHSR
jgi:bifunctional non-homologous end joining protein LigD